MKNVSKYGGYITVGVEWCGLLLCIAIGGVNWSEPISQFGYLGSTRFIFGITFTLGSILYYLFSRTLDAYWSRSSLLSFFAGALFSVMAWVPYEPYVRTFVFDTHNVTILLAVILYSLPMLFIGYKKVHHAIAHYSRIGFFTVLGMISVTTLARAMGFSVFLLQLSAGICFQAWIITVNYLATHNSHRKQDTLL